MAAQDLPQLPAEALDKRTRQPFERIQQELRRFMGFLGDPLDMAVTYRSLVDAGMIDLSAIRRPGSGVPPGPIVLPPADPGTGTAYVPDLTPPPSVTGLSATAAISHVIVEWDVASYSVGHGPATTRIYAAQRNPGDADPVFADAVLVYEATHPLTIASIPSEPNIRWHIWAKFATVDGVASSSPAGGTNGVQAQTGQDVRHLLDVLSQAATDTSLPYSRVSFRADQFYIAADADFSQEATPTGTAVGQLWFKPSTAVTKRWDGAAWQPFNVPLPFLVQTAPTTINGVSIPAGVYMDSAFIYDLTASIARLGNAWIDNAKIADVSAAKLTAGSIGVGSYIRSTSYVSGSSGWTINADGTAEFAAASIRGQLVASQIDGNGLIIRDGAGAPILGSGYPLAAINASSALRNDYVPTGVNLIYNSAFEAGMDGWEYSETYVISPDAVGINLYSPNWRLLPVGAPWTNVHSSHQSGRDTSGTAGSSYYALVSANRVPITAGARYILGGYTQAHRCAVVIMMRVYNASGTLIDDGVAWSSNDMEVEGVGFGNALANYKRQYASYTAISGAAYAQVQVRKYNTKPGYTDSYLFATRLQLEEVAANATTPSAWSDGARQHTINAGNVSTYIASAAIGIAHINTATIGSLSALSANMGAVTIDTTGHVKGGQTAYATGTGFFLGYSGAAYKFSIGSGASMLTWDGSTLSVPAISVSGQLVTSQFQTGSVTFSDVSVYSLATVYSGAAVSYISTYYADGPTITTGSGSRVFGSVSGGVYWKINTTAARFINPAFRLQLVRVSDSVVMDESGIFSGFYPMTKDTSTIYTPTHTCASLIFGAQAAGTYKVRLKVDGWVTDDAGNFQTNLVEANFAGEVSGVEFKV